MIVAVRHSKCSRLFTYSEECHFLKNNIGQIPESYKFVFTEPHTMRAYLTQDTYEPPGTKKQINRFFLQLRL